jgi:hypothetical protein
VRRDLEWLRDILEAIEQIDNYAGRGRDPFETDELIRVRAPPVLSSDKRKGP